MFKQLQFIYIAHQTLQCYSTQKSLIQIWAYNKKNLQLLVSSFLRTKQYDMLVGNCYLIQSIMMHRRMRKRMAIMAPTTMQVSWAAVRGWLGDGSAHFSGSYSLLHLKGNGLFIARSWLGRDAVRTSQGVTFENTDCLNYPEYKL